MTKATPATVPSEDLGAIEWVIIEEWGHVEVVIRWEGHPVYHWVFCASIGTPTAEEIITHEGDSLIEALTGLAGKCKTWLQTPKIGHTIPVLPVSEEMTSDESD